MSRPEFKYGRALALGLTLSLGGLAACSAEGIPNATTQPAIGSIIANPKGVNATLKDGRSVTLVEGTQVAVECIPDSGGFQMLVDSGEFNGDTVSSASIRETDLHITNNPYSVGDEDPLAPLDSCS